MDMLGLISLGVGLLSLIAGIVGVWYARDAAIVGRKAFELANIQAKSAPRLEVSLDGQEDTFVVVIGAAEAKQRQQSRSLLDWQPPEIELTRGDRDKADGELRVEVLNPGNKPANGLTGWLRFSPAFCRPLKGGFTTVLHRSGWTILENDPYAVEIWEDKLTPGTRTVFNIPVRALAPGQCAVSYELLCDEGATTKGNLAVVVKLPGAK